MPVPPWLARLALAALKDPKKTARTIVYIAIGAVASILIIGIIAMNMISALFDYTDIVNADEDLSKTELYQAFDKVHQDYIEQLDDAQRKIYDAIDKANTWYTYEEEEADSPNGGTMIVNKKIPHMDVAISNQINLINYAYYFTYVNYVNYGNEHVNVMFNKKYKPDIKDLKLYTRTISTLVVDYDEEYIVDLTDKKAVDKLVKHIEELGRIDDTVDSAHIENKVMKPQEVDDYYFPDDPEHQEFLVSFDIYLDFMDWLNIGNGGVITDPEGGDLEDWEPEDYIPDPEAEEVILNVPAYYQDDYHDRYGGGTIASSGCGPTCLAMVVSYTSGSHITPPDVASWAGNKYYVPGVGSSWSLFYNGAANYGAHCSSISRNADTIMEAISSGRPVIASMGPGTFTKGGHFIVIIGFTKDGFFIVNDPNKGNVQKYHTKKFSIGTVMDQAKAFWAVG